MISVKKLLIMFSIFSVFNISMIQSAQHFDHTASDGSKEAKENKESKEYNEIEDRYKRYREVWRSIINSINNHEADLAKPGRLIDEYEFPDQDYEKYFSLLNYKEFKTSSSIISFSVWIASINNKLHRL